MKNIRREAAIFLQLGAFAIIWVVVLLISGVEFRINWEALKRFPEVFTIYSALHLSFTAWAWRLSFFQGWLVPLPDLQGSWAGAAQSTWVDPENGQRRPPFPVLLVIRQSFTSVSCVLYSEESSSFSTAAQITGEEDGFPARLSFTYSNRPKAAVRERSQMHDGAAILRIVTGTSRVLEGEYWTDRKTTGDLQVLFRSKVLSNHFDYKA
ncbi:MAG TPA: hypothetical protein VJN93_01710 [Candidatus Acidoferrum sp.]|nr:hypothetical protein [Candidatus Acidoferrum sp.]